MSTLIYKLHWKRVNAIWRDVRRRAFEDERKMRTAAYRQNRSRSGSSR